MNDQKVRVLLVDDHDVVRAGTRSILEARYEIVGEADNVDSAIELIMERQPELVIIDVRLPGGGGEAVVRSIRRRHPEIKFLALTVSTSRDDVIRMMDAGVDGYLTKTTASADLPDLVDQAARGQRPVSPDVAGYLLDIDEEITTEASLTRLTPREREVVSLIARGYSYKETSRRLGVSIKTLESHMGHIFEKLSVASRHELTALAYDEGYVRPDDVV